jgi:RHS repeat-associated protein
MPETQWLHYAGNPLAPLRRKRTGSYVPKDDTGFMQSLIAFFTRLWAPGASDAERLGTAFVYDEQGSLIAEVGMGGAYSSGSTQYIYLPTAGGPMPIAAVINGALYAVHSDQLNTPRRLTNASEQAVWQWAYSAFGDEDPTTAAKRFTSATTPSNGSTSAPDLIFNLGYWGMYRDKESGLAQNRHRYYDARTGRYTQPDPIGWAGGSNPFTYVEGNPVSFVDPDGLQTQKGFTRKPTDLIPLEGGGGGGLGGGPTVSGRSLLGGKPSAGGQQCPPEVRNTLDRIRAGEGYPHRNDGTVFQNREGLLPPKADGYYREWVHPTPGVQGPGLQRVVTGQGGEAYYTPDHYRTFIPVP